MYGFVYFFFDSLSASNLSVNKLMLFSNFKFLKISDGFCGEMTIIT